MNNNMYSYIFNNRQSQAYKIMKYTIYAFVDHDTTCRVRNENTTRIAESLNFALIL